MLLASKSVCLEHNVLTIKGGVSHSMGKLAGVGYYDVWLEKFKC